MRNFVRALAVLALTIVAGSCGDSGGSTAPDANSVVGSRLGGADNNMALDFTLTGSSRQRGGQGTLLTFKGNHSVAISGNQTGNVVSLTFQAKVPDPSVTFTFTGTMGSPRQLHGTLSGWEFTNTRAELQRP